MIVNLFKRFVIFLIIAISLESNAQNTITETKADSLLQVLHLPTLDSLLLISEESTLNSLRIIWKRNRKEIKNGPLIKLFQKIENLAIDNKNPGLEMSAAIWRSQVDISSYRTNNEVVIELERIIKRAEGSGVLWVEIIAKYNYAVLLVEHKQDPKKIEKGIWTLRENIEKIHKKGDVNLTSILIEHYRKLTYYYYQIDDFPNAILYCRKALNIDFPSGFKLIPSNTEMFKSMNNNLGVYYRERQLLDSSTFYFKKVFHLPLTKNSSSRDSLHNAISGGNLGENLYLEGNYQDALPLLQMDADMSTKVKSWGNASNALILIADIYLLKGDIKEAKKILDKAIFNAHSSKEIKRLGKLYPILSKYYKTIGQPNLALKYADSTIFVMDSLKRKNNLFRGTKVEQAYNKHQIKRAAEKELKTKNSNIRRRNIGLFLLLFLLFIGYVIFRRFKLKAKQKERKLVNNVVQITEKLSLKDEQIKNKNLEIRAKNNSINWREFKINSDEQWEKFLKLFQKEHPKFIYHLKSRFPSITAAEIRLLCLTRLGIDDIAKALILGVNVNSVSQTRRRFMRKSKIESLVELKELIFNM